MWKVICPWLGRLVRKALRYADTNMKRREFQSFIAEQNLQLKNEVTNYAVRKKKKKKKNKNTQEEKKTKKGQA